MDRATFLDAAAEKLSAANAEQDRRLRAAGERAERIQEITTIMRPYDAWFHDHRVRTALNLPTQHQGLLTWMLAFADEISMLLSIRDDAAKAALEMSLSFSKGGHPALYVELPFAHSVGGGQHMEAKALAVRLNSGWSSAEFETFIQDLVTAFLDDAPRHGGTAVLGDEPQRAASPF